jgi:hypothetical protein
VDYQSILAHLNLRAVLPNLEALVANDDQAAAIAKKSNMCIRFRVRNGPDAYVKFEQGACRVGQGDPGRTDILLFFTSCEHLNKMFDGQSNPIPLKGFTKIGFLTGTFQKLTDRLEYFLKPDDTDAKKDADYTAINTNLMMLTAARAISVLSKTEGAGRAIAAGIPDGSVLMKVLPDGPAVSISFKGGQAEMVKGEVDAPLACMFMKNEQIANDLLNQKLDPFAAIAGGDVMIRGQIPMLDGMDLMLDRIGLYLE